MLMLSREAGKEYGSSFTIQTSDGPVVVKLVEQRGRKIRVGVIAPRSVAVVRDDAVKLAPGNGRLEAQQ